MPSVFLLWASSPSGVCDWGHGVWSIYSAELQLLIPFEVTNGLQKPISAGFQTGLYLTEQIRPEIP